MASCEDDVFSAMREAQPSPGESKLVEEFCGNGCAPFMIICILMRRRAAAKLAALMKASGHDNDEKL